MRNYSNTALDTTLIGDITALAGGLTVASASGWPTPPFAAVIDPGIASFEEVVQVTGTVGTTWTITRGFDGTTPVAHIATAVVRHAVIAADFTDLQTADSTNAAAIAAHIANTSNPHSTTAAQVAAVPLTQTQGGTPGSPATVDMWTFQPANTTNSLGPFKSHFYAQTFSGVIETVWSTGYNVGQSVAKPAAYMTIHPDAGDVPSGAEIQWNFVTANGLVSVLPIQAVLKGANNTGEVSITLRHGYGSTDAIIAQNADGSSYYFSAGPADGGIRVYSALKILPNSGIGTLQVRSASGGAQLDVYPSGTNEGDINLWRSDAIAWQLNQINGELRFKDYVNNVHPITLRPGSATTAQIAFVGKLGFNGTSPIAKPAALPVDASDLPTAIALVNYIKNSVLIAYGLAT